MPNQSSLRSTMKQLRHRILGDEAGATAIEYALMASAIGATLAAAILALGTALKTNFYDAIAALF